MKIRIKGNSIRLRLSRSEVAKLDEMGYLEERTSFGKNAFVYALKTVEEEDALSATFDAGKLTVLMPKVFTDGWPENNTVGFASNMALTETDNLYIQVEKDFICIDETTEDQSDNYQNPNKTC